MFNSDEINKIKEAFERLKNTSHITYPYIDEKLNEVRRTEDNEFETFRYDSSSSAYKAAIGWKDQNYHYAYKEGFFRIAHMSIIHAKDQTDMLVYPIIFNYRHYLELVLKEYILKFQTVFLRQDKKLHTHDLKKLLDKLLEILEPQKLGFLISSKQKKVIMDFHKIDSKNDAFRYIYDTKGNLNHKYEQKEFNLLEVHYTMNEIYNDFNALDNIFDGYFVNLLKEERK
ncbi:hypothetical protein [Bacillus paralicheniformis]|uniref:hypothetical protein n=1 Tax=Bacillus paralicheniformis TaxID=1648923 RepID=UPI00237CAF4A|nr:hypothetical protein [Bacillus paralicheniformis]MDE1362796.1 hypothetical protein [Bacillus paralicheniformis]